VFRATRAHDDTLTVCHIATASIYLHADGWYWLCPGERILPTGRRQ
jgi:hypothetical protein